MTRKFPSQQTAYPDDTGELASEPHDRQIRHRYRAQSAAYHGCECVDDRAVASQSRCK